MGYPDTVCFVCYRYSLVWDFPRNMITWRSSMLSLVLLIIFAQMTALLMFGSAFIDYNHVTISPYNFYTKGPHNEITPCQALPLPAATGVGQTAMIVSRIAVILAIYMPLVLVAFALLSSLLSAYGGDLGALQLSLWLQAASSGLTLLGLVWFVGLYWAYASPWAMTRYFYGCVGVPVELTFTMYQSSLMLSKPMHRTV